MSEITKRLLTDDTGQEIVGALEDLALAVKPTGAEIDMSSTDTTKIKDAIETNSEAISKLKNYTQITGSTKTAIESALVTFSGNMVNGEQRAIYFANGTASAPMSGTTYIGMIGKQENRLIVQVHGISAVYQDLTGFYKSGTGWEWYSLNQDIAGINTPSLISVSDFNSLTTPGRYSLGGNYTNAPKQNLYGYVDVVTYGSNTYAQTVYSFASTGSTIYERRLSGSTWGSWQELALKSEVAATTVSLGALTANTLTKHQFSITVPSGYKTSAAIHFVIVDSALSNNAIITVQVLPNQTDTATAEVLVYAIGAVSSDKSRLQLYVECVR